MPFRYFRMLNLDIKSTGDKFYHLLLINCQDFSFALLMKTVVANMTMSFLETSVTMFINLGVTILG